MFRSAVDNVEIGSLIPKTIGLSCYSHVYSYGARALSISGDGSVIKQLYCMTAVSALWPHQVTDCIITKSTESKML